MSKTHLSCSATWDKPGIQHHIPCHIHGIMEVALNLNETHTMFSIAVEPGDLILWLLVRGANGRARKILILDMLGKFDCNCAPLDQMYVI